jgi:hypothetical protein
MSYSETELSIGSFVEIINYSHGSTIPRDKVWYVVEYNKNNDIAKIVSSNKKHSYRINGWRLATVSYDKEEISGNAIGGGLGDIPTDEE